MIRIQPRDAGDEEEEVSKARQGVIENIILFTITVATIRAGKNPSFQHMTFTFLSRVSCDFSHLKRS